MDVREKLVELMCESPLGSKTFEQQYYKSTITKIADYLIAHGVTVQKHGRWLLDGRCSECLENPLTTHKTYCPSCGAKMDLER